MFPLGTTGITLDIPPTYQSPTITVFRHRLKSHRHVPSRAWTLTVNLGLIRRTPLLDSWLSDLPLLPTSPSHSTRYCTLYPGYVPRSLPRGPGQAAPISYSLLGTYRDHNHNHL